MTRDRKRRDNLPAKAAKEEIRYLERTRAMQAAARIEILFAEGDGEFPSVAETLWKLYNSDDTAPKDKVSIAKTLASFIGFKERALAEAGVSKKAPKKVVNNNSFTQVNLSLEDLERLPEDIREKMVLQTLVDARGGKE